MASCIAAADGLKVVAVRPARALRNLPLDAGDFGLGLL